MSEIAMQETRKADYHLAASLELHPWVHPEKASLACVGS